MKYLARDYWSLLWLLTKIRLSKIKARIWNNGILLWWYRTDFYRSYIMKGEFDPSLDMDHKAMLVMMEEEKKVYLNDLTLRRNRAHKKDLKK